MNLNTRAREEANCSRNSRRIKNPVKFKNSKLTTNALMQNQFSMSIFAANATHENFNKLRGTAGIHFFNHTRTRMAEANVCKLLTLYMLPQMLIYAQQALNAKHPQEPSHKESRFHHWDQSSSTTRYQTCELPSILPLLVPSRPAGRDMPRIAPL